MGSVCSRFWRLVVALATAAGLALSSAAYGRRPADLTTDPWGGPASLTLDAEYGPGEWPRNDATIGELRRLFDTSPGAEGGEEGPIAMKALLSLPLATRGNGLEVFMRPESEIYATYVKRISLRQVKRHLRVVVPAGSIAIDTHVHTCYSPDSLADISQILLTAAHRGLAGIAITDHNVFEGAQRAIALADRLKAGGQLPHGFFIIPGEEVSSSQGHIIALFLTARIPPGLNAQDTVAAIHAQGGLAIAAHPFLQSELVPVIDRVPFDGVETKNGDEEFHFAQASQRARERRAAYYAQVRKARMGASDAHDPAAVGACYTLVQCAPTPEGVRAAIAAGQTTPMTALSEDDLTRATHRPAIRLLSALDGMKDVSPWLSQHLPDVTLALWPRPGLQWSRPL